MKISLSHSGADVAKSDLVIIPTFFDLKTPKLSNYNDDFTKLSTFKGFKGGKGEILSSITDCGKSLKLISLGNDNSKFSSTLLSHTLTKIMKGFFKVNLNIAIDFSLIEKEKEFDRSFYKSVEAILMANYSFDKYKTGDDKKKDNLKSLLLLTTRKTKIVKDAISKATIIAAGVHKCRDYINEPPNWLTSERFATELEKDAKSLSGVKIKVLKDAQIKKEKMGLLLSVNAGSNHAPRVVHLTYTPSKVTKNTKHIALVGKGLTFDTGGYSLKPSASMMGMKGDIGGAATVYGAFRAAVQLKSKYKLTCVIGITDNMISSRATTPDSIITARNGKTVEILNTDAEGRLVLADVLDYTSDLKPNVIIDAATLTGAMLVALGTEICGLFDNSDKLCDSLLASAKEADEYMWRMPIIDEFRNDMKSPIADLKNMASSRWGGSSKAAAFLENFIGDKISWAHLDIAGVSEAQSHLPFCPSKGGSGVIVRTLVEYLTNGKV